MALAPVFGLDHLVDGRGDAGEVRLSWHLNLHEVSKGCLQLQVRCASAHHGGNHGVVGASGNQRVQQRDLLEALQDIDSSAHVSLIRPFRIGI